MSGDTLLLNDTLFDYLQSIGIPQLIAVEIILFKIPEDSPYYPLWETINTTTGDTSSFITAIETNHPEYLI